MVRQWRDWLAAGNRAETLGRVGLLVFFLWFAGRHGHDYFGFTRFLQMDAAALAQGRPELRDLPLYTYDDTGGYDGHYYARIATDPFLREAATGEGMDNFAYRARRMLPGVVAHGLAGGEVLASIRYYAALNLVVWLGFAAVLWRLVPCGSGRGLALWAGLLFAAGTLHAVRCALPDLWAVTLIALGFRAAEAGRAWWAGLWLALAGLSRETSLLAVAAVLPWMVGRHGWRAALTLGLVAALPVVAWLGYVQLRLGGSGGGWDNFALPFAGWVGKWREVLGAVVAPDRHWLLAWGTLLGLVAMTVQAIYLVVGRDWRSPWWWLGLAYAGFMGVLNDGVWEGHPGAFARVLLPLSLAFAVLAARRGAGWLWVAGGGAAVLGGLLTLVIVHHNPAEFGAGRLASGAYLARVGPGFFGVEGQGRKAWAWCAGSGELDLAVWPRSAPPVAAAITLTARTVRTVSVSQDGRELWRGEVGPSRVEVELTELVWREGRVRLRVESAAEPFREPGPHGRELSFALAGVRLR